MTAEHDLPVNNVNETQLEAGTILKQKREELGLSQKQIADRLRLRLSIIENIENNQFASEQVATFTRGYLRSYAKAVNIDEEIVLSALSGNADAQHKEQEMTSFSRQTKREKHDSRIMTLTWGIFAIIIGISAVWVWQNQLTGEIELTSASEQELAIEAEIEQTELRLTATEELAPVDAVEVTGETVVEATPEVVISTEEQSNMPLDTDEVLDQASIDQGAESQVTEPQVTEPQASEDQVSQQTPMPTTTPEVLANQLEMTFNGDCWIQVKDASGKTLSTGVKKTGQTLQLNGEKPYKLILGAPENVSMTLASEPVDLSGYTSGKVARFTLP